MELYAESLCVLAYHQTGALPTGCRCGERDSLLVAYHFKPSEKHHVDDIDAETRKLVETHLVAFDIPLYAAVGVFRSTSVERGHLLDSSTLEANRGGE